MMRLTHGHSIGLGPGLAPDLQQGLAILGLGHAALAVELRSACEANPVLEEEFGEPSVEPADTECADRFDDPPKDDLDSEAWMRWLGEFPGSMVSSQRKVPDQDWPKREPVAPATASLGEFLVEQVAFTKVPAPIRRVAEIVANCLDGDGFLEASPGEILELARELKACRELTRSELSKPCRSCARSTRLASAGGPCRSRWWPSFACGAPRAPT